jgi:DNA-binding MarR family transcriptional regulator
MGIARDFQNRAMRELGEERGYADLRPSFGPLLSLIAIQARPLGALAEQLSISPQACSQLVNLAEEAGYLERRSDPADRRSRLVTLTSRGEALVAEAVRVLRDVESDYRALVGKQAFARFTAALAALSQGLGLPTPAGPGREVTSLRTIGVLPLISVRLQQDLMDATAARGHAGLKMSHAQVLPLIGSAGARVSELARIQRVSRQAISATARDLEGLAYLRREADPRDRRGVVFRLTAKGDRLIEASVASLDQMDATFVRLLGTPRTRALEATARDLYQALHLEEEIFEARAIDTPSNATRHPGSESERGPARGSSAGQVRGQEPEPAARPSRARDASEPALERLAASLRRQLGERDAGRLAALLEARD